MTRLKLKIVQNFIQNLKAENPNHGTANALALLIVLSRYQNQFGTVEGVYYKKICEDMHCSVQTYYHSRYILEQMGLIRCQKNHYLDCDITIIGNDFIYANNRNPMKQKQDSYINTNQHIFYTRVFYSLKVQEMCLLLLFLAYTESAGRKGVALFYRERAEFYKEYMELFGCSAKTLRGYIHTLKTYFPIKTRKHETKDGKKYMLFVNALKPQYKELEKKTEEAVYTENAVQTVIRREGIESTEKEIIDTAVIMRQYKRILGGLESNVKAVIDIIKRKVNKFKPRLEPAFIHKALRETYPIIEKEFPRFSYDYEADDLIEEDLF